MSEFEDTFNQLVTRAEVLLTSNDCYLIGYALNRTIEEHSDQLTPVEFDKVRSMAFLFETLNKRGCGAQLVIH